MSMAVGTGKGPKCDINITPYIDILLVLLIIFMVITPVRQLDLEVKVPQTSAGDSGPEDTSALGRDRGVDVGNRSTCYQPGADSSSVSWRTKLLEIYSARANKNMFISASAKLPYGDVVKIIDLAKGAGVQDVGLLTRNPLAGHTSRNSLNSLEAIMRVNKKWLVILALSAAIPLSGCGFITKLRARDALNKGVKAFVEQKYEEASKLFEESIRLDPHFSVARMYLATTYTSQFVPGSPDPKSKEMADKAIADLFGDRQFRTPKHQRNAQHRESVLSDGGIRQVEGMVRQDFLRRSEQCRGALSDRRHRFRRLRQEDRAAG